MLDAFLSIDHDEIRQPREDNEVFGSAMDQAKETEAARKLLPDKEILCCYCHIFLWTLFIKHCYNIKFNFSLQKGFDGYCNYFLADCFICE